MQTVTLTPLVVDLDGTLTPTDTAVESIIRLIKKNPLYLLRLPFWLFKGRAVFKDAVACNSSFIVEHLPYREPLLAYLHTEKEKGRLIILARRQIGILLMPFQSTLDYSMKYSPAIRTVI